MSEHNVYKLIPFQRVSVMAETVICLVAHSEFKTLPRNTNEDLPDFCGILR